MDNHFRWYRLDLCFPKMFKDDAAAKENEINLLTENQNDILEIVKKKIGVDKINKAGFIQKVCYTVDKNKKRVLVYHFLDFKCYPSNILNLKELLSELSLKYKNKNIFDRYSLLKIKS